MKTSAARVIQLAVLACTIVACRKSTAVPADGKKLFATYCARCHGVNGNGESAVKNAFGANPPRNLTDAKWQKDRSDDALVKVITSGKGAMPSFASALAPDQIRALVKHIRNLAKGGTPGRTPP